MTVVSAVGLASLAFTGVSIAEEATSEISAVAFQDLNCSDFEYQEDAQAELERDPSDPHDLDGDPEDGVACEGLPSRGAQPTTPTTPAPPPAETTESAPQPAPVEQTTTEPAFSDKNCADFATQAQAQATLDADPSDPHNLDADNDGEACERHFAGTSGDDDQQVSVYPSGGVDTGGRADDDAGLLALGGLVLVGAGAAVVIRRRAQGGIEA